MVAGFPPAGSAPAEDPTWSWIFPAMYSSLGVVILFMTSKLWSPFAFKSYRKLDEADKLDWDSRYASTVHACIVTLAAPITITQWAMGQSASITLWSSQLTCWCLSISLGYFIADTTLLLVHFPKMGDGKMAAHHIVAALSVFSAVSLKLCHVYTLAMLCTECTTPFINMRWFLVKTGLRHSKLYLYNGLTMMFSWIVMRVILFLFYFASIYQHWGDIEGLPPGPAFAVVVVPILLSILNMMWFTKIIKGAAKLLQEQSNSK